MAEKIRVEALRGVQILAEDDLYDLAKLFNRLYQAKASPGVRVRTTSNGLANIYCHRAHVECEQVLGVLHAHGLPPAATIESDDEP